MKRPIFMLDSEDIANYLSGMSMYQLAAKHNVSRPTIRTALQLQGIPLRSAQERANTPQRTAQDTAKTFNVSTEDIAKYHAGYSTRYLAKEYSVSSATMWKALRRAGITTRNNSLAQKANPIKNTIGMDAAQKRMRELVAKGEYGKYVSAGHQKIPLSEWKEFKRTYWQRIYFSVEWKLWRAAVYKRDNYTCRMCKKKSGILHPHHIYKKVKYPEKMFNVDNGVTLCKLCHCSILNYEDDFIDFFERYILHRKLLLCLSQVLSNIFPH